MKKPTSRLAESLWYWLWRQVPCHMINYALGAVITADLREKIVEEIGSFDAGNRRWYPWLSKHLLAGGETRPTQELLEQFLGRPVTPQALIKAMQGQQVQTSNGIARTNRHRANSSRAETEAKL